MMVFVLVNAYEHGLDAAWLVVPFDVQMTRVPGNIHAITIMITVQQCAKLLLTSIMKEHCSTRQIDEVTFDGTIHEDTYQRHVLVYCVCIFINC
jgi:hypothetical protein